MKNVIPRATRSVTAHVTMTAFYDAVVVMLFATIHAVIIAKINA